MPDNKKKPPVDIIVPVYSGYEDSVACLESVCHSLDRLRSRAAIVVIFDAGPDLTLRDYLLNLASQRKITLLINESNQGFVRSVNQGILRSSNDVLILNSDTIVANDWLDRIVQRAYTSTNVATVTPFSNNAEICSWPRICQNNSGYPHATVAEIDAVFATLNSPPVSIPTAVGFCMFIKRSCIERIGVFDAETFGRGYGEENDFCMRASALNYTHLLATDVYVHHHGGVSFGAEKQALVERAVQRVAERYPGYLGQVARHIEDDPARKWRFAAELLLGRDKKLPLVLHITHGIGGGTDRHAVELSRYCVDNQQHAMVVPLARYVRLVFPNVQTDGLFQFGWDELHALKNLLLQLSLSRIHIHHVKGWESRIEEVLQLLGVPFDITLHDYYFLHVNPALANRHGRFCAEIRDRDEVCAESIAFPDNLSADAWRQRWLRLLNRAERVFAPSNAAAAIYNAYHPELAITCAYHTDHERLDSYPSVVSDTRAPDQPLHVVVIGAISIIKGADILERAARLAHKRALPMRFTLIGYAYRRLDEVVRVTGIYDDAQLSSILESEAPDLVWFPCTWPETYSYTLSAALEAGLPVACPDLGSFPERLQNRPLTWVEPWTMTAQQWLARLEEIGSELCGSQRVEPWPRQPQSAYSYARDYYHSGLVPDLAPVKGDQLMSHWLRELPRPTPVEGPFFRILRWFNGHYLFGFVVKLVPLGLRITVKRKLTIRPMHD